MYNVSENYIKAQNKLSRTTKITGEIKLIGGNVIEITNDDIMQGTLNIDNACINSQEFELGAVYCGQLKMSLYTNIDRYSIYGAEIKLYYHLKLENGEFEIVPLGVFTVNEAIRSGNSVSITAYDNMIKLDKEFIFMTSGTVWEMYSSIIKHCEIEAGNTEEEINEISPKYENGEPIRLRTNIENSIDTFRDLLSQLAMTCGGFATIDRFGRLVIRRFGSQISNISDVHIKKTDVSDYLVKFDGVTTQIENEIYSAGEEGNILELTSDLWGTGISDQKQAIIDSIWEAIQNVNYTPYTIDYDGDPAMDLGDEIVFQIRGGETVKSLIMKNNFTYKNSHKIEAVGSNPLFAKSQTKTSKEYNKVQQQLDAGFFRVDTFKNSTQYEINQNRQRIVDMTVYTNKATTSIIHGQAILNIIQPCTIAIEYEVNKALQLFKPIQTIANPGYFILNFYCPAEVKSTTSGNQIEIYIDAIDATETVGTIAGNAINVSTYGSIIGEDSVPFTGKIKIEEIISMQDTSKCELIQFTDEVSYHKNGKRPNFSEKFKLVNQQGVQTYGIDWKAATYKLPEYGWYIWTYWYNGQGTAGTKGYYIDYLEEWYCKPYGLQIYEDENGGIWAEE